MGRIGRAALTAACVVLLGAFIQGCSRPSDTHSTTTYVCGTKTGFNQYVYSTVGQAQPITIDEVGQGLVVIQVAECSAGVDIALSPATAKSFVSQQILDSHHKVVGLVLEYPSGKDISVYQVHNGSRHLIATINALTSSDPGNTSS